MISINISNFLKQKMREGNINRKELSLKTNLSYNSIRNLEQGNKQNPSVETILKVADYFNTSIDEVVTNKKTNVIPIIKVSAQEAILKLKEFIKNKLQQNNIKPHVLAKSIGVGYETINDFIHPIPKKQSLGTATVFKIADHWDVSIDEMIGRTIPVKELNILKPLETISKKTVSSKPSIVGISNISDIKNIEKIKAAMTSLSNKSNIDSKSSKPVSPVAKLNASRNKKDDTPSR